MDQLHKFFELTEAMKQEIEERKLSRKALQESKEQSKRYLEAIDSMGMGLFILDGLLPQPNVLCFCWAGGIFQVYKIPESDVITLFSAILQFRPFQEYPESAVFYFYNF